VGGPRVVRDVEPLSFGVGNTTRELGAGDEVAADNLCGAV